MAKERDENANAIVISCNYLETIGVASQVKSNLSGIESLFNTRKFEPERSESRKSESIKDNTSCTSSLTKQSVSNLPNNSIEAKLLVSQTETKARREIAFSRKRQELEETEIMYAVEEANEKLKLTEILEELRNKGSDRNKHQIEHFSQSIPNTSNQTKYTQSPDQSIVVSEQTHCQTDNQARASTSYLNARAQKFIPKIPDTPPPRSSQTHHRRIIRTQTPFKTDGLTRYTAVLPKNEQLAIDEFIDHLVDGQETNLREGTSITPAAMQQWEFESRNLPPIDLVRFDGDPTKWPEFIQSSKSRVHMSFTDSIRMERLISVLDGEPKKCINAFGTNGMFYASALKSLKKQFGNPYLVLYHKLKILFNLPPLSANDHIGQLIGTLTWLNRWVIFL